MAIVEKYCRECHLYDPENKICTKDYSVVDGACGYKVEIGMVDSPARLPRPRTNSANLRSNKH